MYCQISNELNKISYFNFYKKKGGYFSFIFYYYYIWRMENPGNPRIEGLNLNLLN